jgi:RadC-like JAB domain
VALLDSQNGLLRDVQVSEGSLSASIVHPREVFRTAILEACAHLVLVHNHPSGASRSMEGERYLGNPVRSAQVATRAGERTRSRISSEASRTMWPRRARPLPGLLARTSRWLRKKPLSEAPMVGPPADGRARVESSDLRLAGTKESLRGRRWALPDTPISPTTSPVTDRVWRTGGAFRDVAMLPS